MPVVMLLLALGSDGHVHECDVERAIEAARREARAHDAPGSLSVLAMYGPLDWDQLKAILPLFDREEYSAPRAAVAASGKFFYVELVYSGPPSARKSPTYPDPDAVYAPELYAIRRAYARVTWVSQATCEVLHSYHVR